MKVQLEALKPAESQTRGKMNKSALDSLAKSIETHGLLQPIVVTQKGEEIHIVAGHRRVEAMKLLGEKEVEATMAIGETDGMTFAENFHREPLTAIETAQAVIRLIDSGLTTKEISDELVVALPKVREYASLAHLTPKWKKIVGDLYTPLKSFQKLAKFSKDVQDEIYEVYDPENFNHPDDLEDALRGYDVALASAPWAKDSKSPFGKSCNEECSTCPKRSDRVGDLFGGNKKKANCLDVPCFQKKSDEYHENAKTIFLEDHPKAPVLANLWEQTEEKGSGNWVWDERESKAVEIAKSDKPLKGQPKTLEEKREGLNKRRRKAFVRAIVDDWEHLDVVASFLPTIVLRHATTGDSKIKLGPYAGNDESVVEELVKQAMPEFLRQTKWMLNGDCTVKECKTLAEIFDFDYKKEMDIIKKQIPEPKGWTA